MKALWNGEIIAESDNTIVIEGNHYFPSASVHPFFLQESNTHTVCAWKGTASYYNIVAGGKINKDAAWYYPETSDMAKGIKGYIAFWKGVEIIK